jgi:transcriptional regulator with XRE-family HTH domain
VDARRSRIPRAHAATEDEFTLASALIGARSRVGLSQTELAHRMGTSQAAIARIESGRYLPSGRILQRFAEATGTTLRISFSDPGTAAERVRRRTAQPVQTGSLGAAQPLDKALGAVQTVSLSDATLRAVQAHSEGATPPRPGSRLPRSGIWYEGPAEPSRYCATAPPPCLQTRRKPRSPLVYSGSQPLLTRSTTSFLRPRCHPIEIRPSARGRPEFYCRLVIVAVILVVCSFTPGAARISASGSRSKPLLRSRKNNSRATAITRYSRYREMQNLTGRELQCIV